METPNEHSIVDFHEKEARWEIVNDGVMGGKSEGHIVITARETGVFHGEVSLANNGGFSLARRSVDADLSGYSSFRIRCKGDGKVYSFRVYTSNTPHGVSFAREFETSAEEWIEVSIPFPELEALYRGRRVPEYDPFDPTAVAKIGVLISNGQEGSFRLEIDRVTCE